MMITHELCLLVMILMCVGDAADHVVDAGEDDGGSSWVPGRLHRPQESQELPPHPAHRREGRSGRTLRPRLFRALWFFRTQGSDAAATSHDLCSGSSFRSLRGIEVVEALGFPF